MREPPIYSFGFHPLVNNSTNGDFTSHLVGDRQLSSQPSVKLSLLASAECNGNDSSSQPSSLSARTTPKTTSSTHQSLHSQLPLKKTRQPSDAVKCQIRHHLETNNSHLIIEFVLFNSRKHQAARCSPCFLRPTRSEDAR